MSKHIRDLFFGDLRPNIRDYNNIKQYRDASAVQEHAEAQLMSLLDGETKRLLVQLLNAHSEIEGIMSAECFVSGFKIGASLAAEAFSQS